jgi:hypothetical protein
MMKIYTHEAYIENHADFVRHAEFATMLLLEGIEGRVPSLKQQDRYFSDENFGESYHHELDFDSVGLSQRSRNIPLPFHLTLY